MSLRRNATSSCAANLASCVAKEMKTRIIGTPTYSLIFGGDTLNVPNCLIPNPDATGPKLLAAMPRLLTWPDDEADPANMVM